MAIRPDRLQHQPVGCNDSLRAHNGCNNFPKDGSRYISALKKFVYVMPTFLDTG